MDPVTLIGALKTAKDLYSFVRNIGFNEALNIVGDNHYETASRLAKQLTDASDTNATIRTIVGHLEGAHTAYRKQWKSPLNKALAQSGLRDAAFEVAWRKDTYTSILLAMFYIYLKEPAYARSSIDHAKEANTDGRKIVDKLEDAIKVLEKLGIDKDSKSYKLRIISTILFMDSPMSPISALASNAFNSPELWQLVSIPVTSSDDINEIEKGVKRLLN